MLPEPRRALWGQKTQLLGMLLIFVLLILLIQLWLVTIALEEYLAAHATLAIPTFLASLFCFGLNVWLLKYVNDIDRKE
jgi:hypothetical protein